MPDFKTQILLNKTEGFVRQQASKADFDEKDIEKTIKIVKEAIDSKRIKRLNDLRNFIYAELKKVSKERDLNF